MPVICLIGEKFHKSALDIKVYLIMKTGDIAKASPRITGEADWIEGEVIDVEKNPFKGIVISIKDKLSKIFYREENISCLRKCNG